MTNGLLERVNRPWVKIVGQRLTPISCHQRKLFLDYWLLGLQNLMLYFHLCGHQRAKHVHSYAEIGTKDCQTKRALVFGVGRKRGADIVTVA